MSEAVMSEENGTRTDSSEKLLATFDNSEERRTTSSSNLSSPLVPFIIGESRDPTDCSPRRLLSAAIGATMLTAALTLIVLSVRVREKSICTTSACRQFAEFVLRSLDNSAHPCRSFGRFVCGQWTKRGAKATVRRVVHKSALEVLSRRLASVRVPERGQNAREQASALFSSCDAVSRGDSDEVSTVKAYLAEAGVVWPLSPSNPDVLDTLLYLDFELNWASVLHFRVREREGVTKVSVGPATSFSHIRFLGSRLKTKDDKRHYFDVIFVHYADDLPQEHVYSQIKEVEELMTAKLESAMEHVQWASAIPEPIEAGKLYKGTSYWALRLVKHVTIQGHVQYFAVNARFVAEFLRLWSQHGERKAHLYVSWCAVRFAALFANRELLQNHYGDNSDADSSEFRQHCLTESYRVFGEALFSAFSDEILTPHVRREVRDLVLKMRRHCTHRLFSQQSFQEYSSLVAGWGSLDSVFFALEYHLHYDLDIPVAGLPDISRSHVANWRAVSRARRTLNVSLGGALGEDVLLGRSLFHLDKSAKDFVLAPFALVFPMYHIDLTPAVKYGTLVDHVGLATARLALEHSDAWPNTQLRLNRSRQCVAQAFETLPQFRIDEVIAEVTSLSTLLDVFAKSGDDKSLLGMDGYTALQTFFIAWCIMRYNTASLDREEEDPCSPALRLVDAFANAFNCLPGTYSLCQNFRAQAVCFRAS